VTQVPPSPPNFYRYYINKMAIETAPFPLAPGADAAKMSYFGR
jgi:hypothetical protein